MKMLWIASAAGAAMIGAAAAVAQSAAPAPAGAGKVHTRATVQQAVARQFARLDANRDGFVTKAETQAVKARRGDRTANRSERAAKRAGGMFDRIDANRDGAISRAEFDARRAQRQQRVAARDSNGDGRPDVRRMRGGHRMGGLGGRMFEMADGNRDGRVTLQEATGAALQRFDTADANRDGQITREERQQMRSQRRPG